jgi:hypothetical protein
MKKLPSYLMVAIVISIAIVGKVRGIEKDFVVFDGTIYKNKPDLLVYGIKPIDLIYVKTLWKEGQDINDLPEVARVRQSARGTKADRKITIIDIEHWKLSGHKSIVTESLSKYMTTLRWFNDAAPEVLFGYYGLPPLRDYWRAIKGSNTPEYLSWQTENDRLQPLVYRVNVLFPSLYTFYPDREGWVKYAIENIREARRYPGNKPVYVFLWPQYHQSNLSSALKYLPADYWELELETARQYANGIVIWGGWDFDKNAKAQWDDNAPWWQVTKKFMKKLKY